MPAGLTAALQILGASAGLVGLMTFVGGAILWVRFNALGLPADQSITLLPERLLLTIGAHALLGPVVVGLVVVLALVLLQPLEPDGKVRKPFWFGLFVVGVAGFAFVVWTIWEFDDVWPEQVVMLLATVLALAAIAVTAIRTNRAQYVAWIVFAAFAICGAVLAVVRTSAEPEMEPTAMLMKDGKRGLAGFFVGQTSDLLYFAALPGGGDPGDPFADADVDRVISVPRDEVPRVVMRKPVGIRPKDPGRDQAQALLADMQVQLGPTAARRQEVITTANPVVAFAPLVNLHSKEDAWPMSADAFLRSSTLVWRHDQGCRPFGFPGGEHLASAEARRRLIGRFSPRRLAREQLYGHTVADGECRERGRRYTAAEHTRPFDEKGRLKGLPKQEGFALDLRDSRRGGEKRVDDHGPQHLFEGVPIYFERHAESVEGDPGERITYWLFYGVSQPPGSRRLTRLVRHEGDWERVSVLLKRRRGIDDQYVPVSVRYHFHEDRRDVPWYAVKRVGAGGPEAPTHPVVFSARGSHASYPRAGRYENVVRIGGRRRFAVFDEAIACPDCPQWQTWKIALDATVQPWYGFGGAWGQAGPIGGVTGPLGPSRYKIAGLSTSPEQTVGSKPPSAVGGEGVEQRAIGDDGEN